MCYLFRWLSVQLIPFLFTSFHSFIPSLMALSKQILHKKSTHTHKSCQLPSDKIYIRGAYLAQKSRRKHHSIRMHCNHFEIELNLASAIANFRIICTTFIIIDLREFFHSTVCAHTVRRRNDGKTTGEKSANLNDINERKNDTWRIFSSFVLLYLLLFRSYCLVVQN